MSTDAKNNTVAPLRRNSIVYLTKNVRPTKRSTGMVSGPEYKVVDCYEFKDAVRICGGEAEEIVTRSELTTLESLCGMTNTRNEQAKAELEGKHAKRVARLEPVAALLRSGMESVDEIAIKLGIKPMTAWSRVLECRKHIPDLKVNEENNTNTP